MRSAFFSNSASFSCISNKAPISRFERESPAGRVVFAFFIFFLTALSAQGQTSTFTFETNYSATGIDQWGSTSDGYANSTTLQNFYGVTWDEKVDFGGFTTGAFGERYGFAGSAFTNGQVGFDVFFKGTTGSLDINLANTVSLTTSNISAASGATGSIVINQNRLAPTSGNVISSVFPTMEFSLDAIFKVDAGLSGEFAYGVGSSNGTIDLADLTTVVGVMSANPLLATVNPFDTKLRLLSYNLNGSQDVTVGAKVSTLFGDVNAELPIIDLDSVSGLNIPISRSGFIPPTRVGNYDVSANTDIEFGSITIRTPHELDLASGSNFSVDGNQDRIISVGLDPIGLASTLYGLPVNPLDLEVTLPGTPIGIEATLLKAQLNLDLGINQSLSLTPNTHVRLLSNYDVTYDINGQIITTSDLKYLVPNDGSSVTISIINKPTESDWMLTPSVYVSPTVDNELELNFSSSMQVTAGKFGLVYGGVLPLPVISALYEQNFSLGNLGDIDLINRQLNLSNLEEFQQVFRSLRPLVGGAVPENFQVSLGETVYESGLTGTFKAQPIAGKLTFTDSTFDNATFLEIPGTLNLVGTQGNLVGSAGLDVTGTLRIDKASRFINSGAVDENGAPLYDEYLNPVAGFVDKDGVVDSGTYIIGGRLSYQGADIGFIGANASFQLTGNSSESTPRVDNNGHDAFRQLSEIYGSFSMKDLDITTTERLDNSGMLAILGDSTLTAAGHAAGPNALLAIGGGSTFDVSGGDFLNLFAGTLSNFRASIGDLTGGSLIYSGPSGVTTNAGNLILSGTAPTNGYIVRKTGPSTFQDGLATLTTNTGTLIIANGASQTLTGGLTNSGTLAVTMPTNPATPVAPYSTLNIGGALSNSNDVMIDGGRINAASYSQTADGLLQITRGGELNLTGSIGSSGMLSGGQWWIDGIVKYNGTPITGIGAGTDLRISGAGHGFALTDTTNPMRNLATNNGSFALLLGATATSTVGFTNTGSLVVGKNSSFTSNGLTANSGTISVTGAYDTTSGAASNWTSGSSIPLSSGLLTGGTYTIDGSLTYASSTALTGVAAGTTLNINRTVNAKLTEPGYTFGGALISVNPGTGISGNGFASFASVAGTLSLNAGSAVRTDASLSVLSGGTLNVSDKSTLQVTGETFSVQSGGTLDLDGNLVLGGGAHTTTFVVPQNFVFTNNVQLGRVLEKKNSAELPSYYETTGQGALSSSDSWSNSGAIVGNGTISGNSITNSGMIYAAGGNMGAGDKLEISGGTLTNTGIVGSAGNSQFSSRLSINEMNVVNSVTTTKGQISAGSYLDINDSTVTGGVVVVTSTGHLSLLDTTFTDVALTSDGKIDILNDNGSTSTLGGAITLRPTSVLTVKGDASSGAILNVASGSSFTNFGTIRLEENANFTGSTITNRGLIDITGGRTGSLSNINNTASGRVLLDHDTNLQISGTYNNAGRIELSGEAVGELPSGSFVSQSTITLLGDTTLTGGGTLQLGGHNTITSTTATNGDTIQTVNTQWRNGSIDLGSVTITGSGDEVLTLENQILTGQGKIGEGKLEIFNEANGVIRVLGNGSTLAIESNSQGFTNRGTLDVGEGATMTVSGGNFHSFTPASGGNNAVLNEGRYRFAGTLEIDGITNFDNAATIVFGGPNGKMTNEHGTQVSVINNLASGVMEVRDNATYNFTTSAGTTFTNQGTLIAGPGGTLGINGGHFTNFANDTLTGGSYSVAGVLKFDGANVITNDASITMRGSGSIQNAAGQNALSGFAVNKGRFAVDDNGTFTVGAGVSTFDQHGKIVVYKGSTFNFGTATVNNVAGDTPEYWVAGTLKSASPVITDGTHLTLYGTGAHLEIGSNTQVVEVGAGGHLTMAGGYTATYVGGSAFANHGLWEIGSNSALDANGNSLRSGANVTFGNTSQAAVIDNSGGTIRYYGGTTDDGSTPKLTIQNLNAGGGGTLDLNGDINMGKNGSLYLTGVLANTLSSAKFVPATLLAADRPTVTVVGGLDIRHPFDTSKVDFDFTYTSGSTIRLHGTKFVVGNSSSFGAYNSGEITLIDGADLVNTNGDSLFRGITQNSGAITLSNTQPHLSLADGQTFIERDRSTLHFTGATFENTSTGSIAINEYSEIDFDGAVTNYGSITSSNTLTAPVDAPGVQISAQSLTNYGTFSSSIAAGSVTNKTGGTMGGFFHVGTLTNESGATFGGNGNLNGGGFFINHGTVLGTAFTMYPNSGTGQYGEVQNYGDMTLRAGSFVRNDSSKAPIFNGGTLHIGGNIANDLSGGGDLRTDFDSRLSGNNVNFHGDIYVDNAELRVDSDAQLGSGDGSGNLGDVNIGAAGTLAVGGTLATNRVITVADGATVTGYNNASPGVIGSSITTPGILNVGGKLTINSVFGSSLNLLPSYNGMTTELTLRNGAILSGSLTGEGTLTLSEANSLLLHDSTMTGGIRVTNAGAGVGIAGNTFTTSIHSVGQTVNFNQTGPLTYGGIISGTTAVNINNGAVTYDHQQSYTGTTTIASGSSLTFADGASLIIGNGIVAVPVGNVAGNIVNNGALIFATATDQTIGRSSAYDINNVLQQYNYSISGNGTITQAGSGTLTAAHSSFLHNLTISNGKFEMGDGTTPVSGSFNVTNNGVLRMNHTGNATLNVSGSGSFEAYGPGSVTLTMNGGTTVDNFGPGTIVLPSGNTYSGKTRVGSFVAPVHNDVVGRTAGGGRLTIINDSSLGAAPASYVADQLQINGGTLHNGGPSAITLSANRGITIGAQGASIDAGMGLTIPTLLNTSESEVALNKLGAGPLNLLLPVGAANPFAYNLVQGTLNLDNQAGNATIGYTITSSEDSILKITGGGTTTATTSASTFLGRLEVVSGTTLKLNGSTAGSPGASSFNYLTVDGTLHGQTGGVTFKSIVGSGSFIRSGGGTVTVNTLNLGGTVTVPFATLNAPSYNAGSTILGTEGPATLQTVDGVTGSLQIASGTTLNIGNSFTVSGAVTGGSTITKNGDGLLLFGGGGTLTNSFVVNQGLLGGENNTTFSGIIHGAGGFFLGGTGLTDTVRLTANNTFTGDTLISVGELILGNGGTTGSVAGDILVGQFGGVSFNRSGTVTLTNHIEGEGYLKQAGPGTLIVNTDAEYTGKTYITSGTLQIGNGGTTGSLARDSAGDLENDPVNVGDIHNDGTLAFNRSDALDLDNDISGTGIVRQIGSGTTTLHGALTHTGETQVDSGKLVIASSATNAGGIAVASGAALGLLNPDQVGGSIANNGAVTLDGNGNYTIGFNTTGNGQLIKNGTGTALLGNTTHGNYIEIAEGRLGYAVAGSVTSSVQFTGNGTFYKGGSGTLIYTADNNSFTGDVLVDGGTLQLGNGGATGMLSAPISLADQTTTVAFNHSSNLSYDSVISGQGGLHVSGPGILLLTQANTFTGITTIDAGSTLAIGHFAGSIGSANIVNNGALRLQPALTYNMVLDSNSSGSGLIEVQGVGTVTLNGDHTNTGGATIASGASLALGFESSFSGPIANEGNLTILTSTSGSRFMPVTFTGDGSLTVAGGGRLINIGNLTHNGFTILQDNSTLALSIAGTSTFSKSILGSGNLEKTGAGKLVIGASGGVSGDIIVSGGTLEFGAGGFLTSTKYDLQSAGTLAFNFTSPSPTDLNTPFVGSGTIHQKGPGQVTLSGNSSSFTGSAIIDSGTTLNLTGSLDLATITADGTLRFDASGNQTSATTINGSGLVSKLDSGTLTLTGGLGMTGDINVAGPLVTQTRTGSAVGSITAAAFTNKGALTVGQITSPSITNNFGGTLTVTGNHASLTQTILNGGTLIIGNGGTSGSFASDISNNNGFSVGTIVFNRSDEVRIGFASSITGSGDIEQRGTGTLKVYSDQFNTVDVTRYLVTNGTMEFMQPVDGNIDNNATLKLNGDHTYANNIQSHGTLITNGQVNLSNVANSYNGAVNIQTGSLTLASLANPLTGANVTVGSLAGSGTLNYGTGVVQTPGSLTIAGHSTHTGDIEMNGASLNLGGNSASSITFTNGGALTFTNASSATFSGSVSGADSVTHDGTAKLTVDSAVDAIRVKRGALSLGTSGSLNQLTLDNTAGALFDMSNRNVTLTHLEGGGSAGGNIDLGNKTLTINQTGRQIPNPGSGGYTQVDDDTIFGGAITGTGRLVKQGYATLELSGANIFTGSVSVEDGELVMSGTSSASSYEVLAAGKLFANTTANLGAGSFSITLHNNGRFESLGSVALSTAQNVVLDNGGTLAGNLSVGGTVTGSGTLRIDGGRVLLNGSAYTGQTDVVFGTLAIGNLSAINPAKTYFAPGSVFDINGLAWNTAVNLEGASLANGAANAITVSAPITVTSSVGLIGSGSRLTFDGTLLGATPIELRSQGDVALETVSASRINKISVSGGNLSAPLQSLSTLAEVSASGGGKLQFTGQARDLNLTSVRLGGVMNGSGALVNDTNGPIVLDTELNLASFPVTGDIALLGGTSDLTLRGSISGATDLGKIGSGTLTIASDIDISAWNGVFHRPGIDVREGTLAAASSFYDLRHLTVGTTGIATLTDSANLVLRSLTGSGSVNLGSNNLEFHQLNSGETGNGVFTGSVTTTGSVSHNDPSGATFGTTNGDKQSYGKLTANSLTVNVGDVTITNELNVSTITVRDKLTTTTNGISTNSGTVLNANFALIQDTVTLLGGDLISGNTGSVTLQGLDAQLLDQNGAAVKFGSNSTGASLIAQFGAALNLRSTFTNEGYVSVTGRDPGSFLPSYIEGAGTINQVDGQFIVDDSTLRADRLNVSGGKMEVGLSGTFQRNGSGSVLTNPGVVLTGGLLEVKGTINGGVKIDGGTLNAGGNYIVGTAKVSDGVLLGSGGTLAWDISDANGIGGTAFDFLDASRGSASRAKITVASTELNPFIISPRSTTGGNVTNFDGNQNYTWTIATTGSGFNDFSSDKFAFDSANLVSEHHGNFGVTTSGNDLLLTYNWSHYYNNDSAVVEPTNLAANGQFGGLTKDGTGTLTLSGNNAYTGSTRINSGTVVPNSNNALGTGRIFVNTDAKLSVPSGVSISNKVTLAGGEYERTLSGDLTGSIDASSSLGGVNTSARILAGFSAPETILTSEFSKKTTSSEGEGEGGEGSGFSIFGAEEIRSDIYHLDGTGEDNPFVLDLAVASSAISGSFQLGWLDPDSNEWVNATTGNSFNTASAFQQGFSGSFSDFQVLHGTNLASYLGAWGTYTTGELSGAWAVIDHNSYFSLTVVPEPSTAALLALGALGCLGVRRRRK